MEQSFRTGTKRQEPAATRARERRTRHKRWAQKRSANAPISRPSASCTATLKARRSKCACSPIAMPWERSRQNIRKTTKRRSSTHWRSRSRRIPATRPTQTDSRREQFLRNCLRRSRRIPGLAHYIIHAYDVPALAGRALVAAQRYAEIAPDAPHALHMPSHTFTRLGYWQESIDSNVAAAAAARRQGQTAEELHASDYETYAYLQTGQDEAAARIVTALPEMASRFDPKALLIGAGPPSAGYFALAAIPARYALERQDWQQAERLALSETPFPYTDAMTWFARGLGAARLGHAAAANEAATSAEADPGAPFEGQRALLGAAGGNSGHWGLGMVCASGGQERGSFAADGVGGEIGRWDREKRGDTGATVPSAGTARRDVIGDE